MLTALKSTTFTRKVRGASLNSSSKKLIKHLGNFPLLSIARSRSELKCTRFFALLPNIHILTFEGRFWDSISRRIPNSLIFTSKFSFMYPGKIFKKCSYFLVEFGQIIYNCNSSICIITKGSGSSVISVLPPFVPAIGYDSYLIGTTYKILK